MGRDLVGPGSKSEKTCPFGPPSGRHRAGASSCLLARSLFLTNMPSKMLERFADQRLAIWRLVKIYQYSTILFLIMLYSPYNSDPKPDASTKLTENSPQTLLFLYGTRL
jgi:hypothetical protein